MTADTTQAHTTDAVQGLSAISAERIALNVPEQFIEAVRECQAITAAQQTITTNIPFGAAVAALPTDFTLRDLERYEPNRRRMRGTFSTNYIDALAKYVSAFENQGTTVFVNAADMSARAVMDLGTVQHPGHADHCANLKLQRTAACNALLTITNAERRQSDIAEFFEDWAGHVALKFFHDSEELSPRQAIAAVRSITIEQARKVDSEEQQLSANRTAFESVKASSKETLPTHIYFTTKPYPELAERLFVLRLSVKTGNAAPTIVLRIQNMEQHTEEMGNELAALVTKAIDTDVPVVLGSYAKGE